MEMIYFQGIIRYSKNIHSLYLQLSVVTTKKQPLNVQITTKALLFSSTNLTDFYGLIKLLRILTFLFVSKRSFHFMNVYREYDHLCESFVLISSQDTHTYTYIYTHMYIYTHTYIYQIHIKSKFKH